MYHDPKLSVYGYAFGKALQQIYNPYRTWDFYTNIHPRTKSQYDFQRFISGIVPWYGEWMRNRSLDERSQKTLDYYNLSWNDITYPWLSGLSGGNTSASYGSGAWQFSKNLSRLYR